MQSKSTTWTGVEGSLVVRTVFYSYDKGKLLYIGAPSFAKLPRNIICDIKKVIEILTFLSSFGF